MGRFQSSASQHDSRHTPSRFHPVISSKQAIELTFNPRITLSWPLLPTLSCHHLSCAMVTVSDHLCSLPARVEGGGKMVCSEDVNKKVKAARRRIGCCSYQKTLQGLRGGSCDDMIQPYALSAATTVNHGERRPPTNQRPGVVDGIDRIVGLYSMSNY